MGKESLSKQGTVVEGRGKEVKVKAVVEKDEKEDTKESEQKGSVAGEQVKKQTEEAQKKVDESERAVKSSEKQLKEATTVEQKGKAKEAVGKADDQEKRAKDGVEKASKAEENARELFVKLGEKAAKTAQRHHVDIT